MSTRDGVFCIEGKKGSKRLVFYERIGGRATHPISNEELGFEPYDLYPTPRWYDVPYLAVRSGDETLLVLIDRRTSRLAPGMRFRNLSESAPGLGEAFYGFADPSQPSCLLFGRSQWSCFRPGDDGLRGMRPITHRAHDRHCIVDPMRPTQSVRVDRSGVSSVYDLDRDDWSLVRCPDVPPMPPVRYPYHRMSAMQLDGDLYCWDDFNHSARVYKLDLATRKWVLQDFNRVQLHARLRFDLEVDAAGDTVAPGYHVVASTGERVPCQRDSHVCYGFEKFYGRDEYVCTADRTEVFHSRRGIPVLEALMATPFGDTVGRDVALLVVAYAGLPDPDGPKRLAAEQAAWLDTVD